MGARRRAIGVVVAASALALAGCGKIFPFGERLLPATYGPPFGSALKDNQPRHPHNPAADERHAEADAAESRRYRSHQACHAALSAEVTAHGGHGRIARVSSIESIGLYESEGVVHEQRCSDYVLSHRSWCVTAGGHGAAGSGHGDTPMRADPACGGEGSGH